MKKKKLFTTTSEKTEKEKSTFVIKVDQTKLPNKMHLDSQISFPSRTFEDKRKKQPKHKAKIYENE